MQKNIIISFLVVAVIVLGFFLLKPKPSLENDTVVAPEEQEIKDTYTYTNHGFSIELPKEFIVQEIKSETLPTISIELPDRKGWVIYISDAKLWEKNNNFPGQMSYLRDEKIGETTFKVYFDGETVYYFRQGNVAYLFNGNSREYMETFKFVGWPEQESQKYEPFIDMLIKNGVDKIYKYSYEGKIYYYTTDWEVVAADGTPEVYTAYGFKIDCRFGSPMVPVTSETPPINPICKDYTSGTVIYDRK